VLLHARGHVIEGKIAQVNRHPEQGIERCGLWHRMHDVAAPADENDIDKGERQNAGLQ
jgi:hypothetical protein